MTNSHILWEAKAGANVSSPVIHDGLVYLSRENGAVICLDAKTGETIWENRYNVWLSDVPTERIGWSSVVGDPETGNVYAHGTQGFLFCFDGETGAVKWQRSMTEEFGRITGYGGRVTSPVVDGDLVIISVLSSHTRSPKFCTSTSETKVPSTSLREPWKNVRT